MDGEGAHCYNDLKVALQTKFDILPEMYQQKFQSSTVPPGDDPTETYFHLKSLYKC